MSADGWRWAYFFNAIFFGVSGISVMLLYKPPATRLRRENSTCDVLRSMDIIGISLLLCAVIDLVTSLTWGGNAYSWSSARVIALLVLGSVFVVIFGLYGMPHWIYPKSSKF